MDKNQKPFNDVVDHKKDLEKAMLIFYPSRLPTPMMKISKTDSQKVRNTVVKLLMLDFQSFIPINPIKPKKKEMMVRVKIMFRRWTCNEFSTELKILVKLVNKNIAKQINDVMKE